MPAADGSIRWGILGTAKIADKVGPAIRGSKRGVIAAIASRSLERAKAWGAERGIPKAYGSYDELLADPEIDAVYMPLPPSLHLEWVTKAAERGKHILCEKPVAMNVTQMEEMAAVCRRHRVQFMDGTFWVHHPRAKAMRELADSGALGTIRRLTSAFSFRWETPPLDNIRMHEDLGGGALGDLGWYCVRLAWWFFREAPERVQAHARFVHGVDYEMSAIMWFSGDRVASFDCGFGTVMRQWFELAGEVGSIVCDDFVLALSEEKSRFWVHDDQQKATVRELGPFIQQVGMIEDFHAGVERGVPDEYWPGESIRTQRVLDALAKSCRIRQSVELD